MVKRIKQFRFYGTGNTNNNPSIGATFFTNPGVGLTDYMPIVHLGIQTLPGTKIYLNQNIDAPIIIGSTGIYELDLENTTGLISSIQVDQGSMNIIDIVPTAYFIMDIVYETEED